MCKVTSRQTSFQRYQSSFDKSKYDCRSSHALHSEQLILFSVQESGDQLAAFVYVWSPEFENMLDMVPWDFASFMEKDFQSYCAAEFDL